MNERESRTLLPPPGCCRTCVHVVAWHGIQGEHHDCLRGLPMHPDCGWHSQKTESLINPEET